MSASNLSPPRQGNPEKAQLSMKAESYDLSVTVIEPGDNFGELIQKVANTINVQFTESLDQLPFIPFSGFSRLLNEEKVFLVGPSGCGKSRTVIELLKSRKQRIDRVIIINPSNAAGIDSCRETMGTLGRQLRPDDIVIWDNFPDGLVKRDLESASSALEMINSMPSRNLYIALKPKYLEMYRGLTAAIPDICTHEITCDLATMKSMLRSYGAVEHYQDIFEKCVSPSMDRIARILWQKQPLSITVVDYYKSMAYPSSEPRASICPSRAIQIAQAWLPVCDYFARQFEVIKNMPGRERDVELLYILRFCYEAGIDRSPATIEALQKGIFGSPPPQEPTKEIGTWIYLSGQNICMHDSAKNAVVLSDFAKMKIGSYLSSHFPEVFPDSESGRHSLGVFIGRSIQFIADNSAGRLVPAGIYDFMKKNAVFERAFGRGVGEVFELLDEALQESILQYVDTEIEFGVGLADGLGERLAEIDASNRTRVMEKIYHGMLFARYFGQSVGRLYGSLPEELRVIVMSHAEKNPQFADGLGMGLGYVYSTLNEPLQGQIMANVQQSYEMSRGLGFGLGLAFGLQDDAGRGLTVAIADTNSEFDAGFGMGMAVSYPSLPDRLRRFVIDRATTKGMFASGLGIYAAFCHKESCPAELFELMHTNTEVAWGLGMGYGATFFYLPEKFRSDLESRGRSNVKLDEGLGSGLGLLLKHFPGEVREGLIAKAAANNSFAAGLGYGVGFTWLYIGDDLRSRVKALAASNSGFAQGLGSGLGCHLDYLDSGHAEEVISIADSNAEFDRGLGNGAAWAWAYAGEQAQRIIEQRIEARPEFSRGLGFGAARIVRYCPDAQKKRLLARISTDPAFAEGFGEGTGHYLWSTYGEQERQEFVSQAATGSASIARGTGQGIGFLNSYFKPGLDMPANQDIRRGLGIGVGRAYRYMTEQGRTEAFKTAQTDMEFALGLGQGIGMNYGYLEEGNEKEAVISHIGENGFTRGFGIGTGSVFPYLPQEPRNKILAHCVYIAQLSLGLGAGIGARIPYLSRDMVNTILELAEDNPHLIEGIAEGCGSIFQHVSESTMKQLHGTLSNHRQAFAFGLGVGLGMTGTYFDQEVMEEAAAMAGDAEFYNGAAIGLGHNAAYISTKALEDISVSNSGTAARNFGFSLGHVFQSLGSGRKVRVFGIAKANPEILFGLGEGIGHYLPVTGAGAVQEMARFAAGLPHFERGLASGVVESFNNLGLTEAIGLLEYAHSHAEFGKILGPGLAERFASFAEDKRLHILKSVLKDSGFSSAFASAILKDGADIPKGSSEAIRSYIAKVPHLSSIVAGRRCLGA